jgi:hypothetical protein
MLPQPGIFVSQGAVEGVMAQGLLYGALLGAKAPGLL